MVTGINFRKITGRLQLCYRRTALVTLSFDKEGETVLKRATLLCNNLPVRMQFRFQAEGKKEKVLLVMVDIGDFFLFPYPSCQIQGVTPAPTQGERG